MTSNRALLLLVMVLSGCGEPQKPIDPDVETNWMYTDATRYELHVFKGNARETGKLLQAAKCYKVEGQWQCFELTIHDDNDGLTHDTAWKTLKNVTKESASGDPSPRYIGAGGGQIDDGVYSPVFDRWIEVETHR